MSPIIYPTRSVARPPFPTSYHQRGLQLLLAALLLAQVTVVRAQAQAGAVSSMATTGTGRLTGRVVNEKTGQPVEFATVALLEEASGKTLDGAACNDQGRFALAKIGVGRYRVVVSFVGFQPRTVAGVVVGPDAAVDLGPIWLTPTVQQLGEVQVTGERELVENKVDRIVYNAEKDITNAGGSATDVLQKVPLLTVDLNGNLQLRGSSNIRVLVNGKPSAIMASNLADALRQIPADQIKSVEVITSPSAKYDAEGSAGIVNIILNKNNLEGGNGSVNSAVGTRGSFHSLTLNSRRGKLGLNANVGANLFYNIARNDSRRTDFLPEGRQSLLEQRGAFTNLGGGGYGQLGLDYDLTPKDALNLSVRGNVFGYTNARSQFTRFSLPPALLDEYNRDIDTHNDSRNLDLNFGYVRTLPRPRQELSFLALYTVNTGDTDYNLAQQRWADGRDYVDYLENSFNASRNRETTFQTDYVQPLDSTQTVEIGVKTILRNVSSDYRVEADSLDGRSFVLVPSRSNNFRYDQNVYAGYLSYGFAVGKTLTFKVGGRLEHTRIDGDFRSDNTTLRTSYTNLVPSLQAAWDVTKDQKLKLSYTRRIQRPSIFYLNPYLNTSNPRNVLVGNPTLDAELTDAYELGYNTYVNKSSFTFSAYSRQTNNAIEAVSRTVAARDLIATTDSAQLLLTTFQNVARTATYGLSVSGSTKLTAKWTISGNVNYYYMRVHSPALGLENGGTMHNANLTSSWQFDKGWSAQFTGLFNSRRIQLQGRSSGYRSYNLAVKKDLFQKKGSLTLAVINPFNRQLVFRNDLTTDQFTYTDTSYFLNRNLRLSFNYQFGKLENRPARPKKSIRNDDQKEGGNG